LCSDTQLEQLLKFPGTWQHTSCVSHDSGPWELSAGAELVLPDSVRTHWRKPFINLKTMLQGVVKNQVAFFTKGQCCAALGFALARHNQGAGLCRLLDVQYSNCLHNVLLLSAGALYPVVRSDIVSSDNLGAQVTTTAKMCVPTCVTYGQSGGSTVALQQKEHFFKMYMHTSLTEYCSRCFSWACPTLPSFHNHCFQILFRQGVFPPYFQAQHHSHRRLL
jgi:hypothetical protein